MRAILLALLLLCATATAAIAQSAPQGPGARVTAFGRTLYPGMGYGSPSSPLVRDLQRALARSGYEPGPIDGRFGPLTERAVVHYQADRGLQVDGIVGPRTQMALNSPGVLLYPRAGYHPRSSRLVRTLQRLLARSGYAPGPVDGRFGTLTERALFRYQADHHLRVDAVAGPRVFSHLLSSIRPRHLTIRHVGPALGTTEGRALPERTTRISTALVLICCGLLGLGCALVAVLRSARGRSEGSVPPADSLGDAGEQPLGGHEEVGAPTGAQKIPGWADAGGRIRAHGPIKPAVRIADINGDTNVTFHFGVLLEEQGDLVGAEAAYRGADERGHGGAACNLGILLEHRDDVAGALAAYRRAEARGEPNGIFNLGVLLEEHGDVAGAEAAYRGADQRGHTAATCNLGVLLESQELSIGAERAYRRADARGAAAGAFNLGALLEARGDLAGAASAYRRARKRGDGQVACSAHAALRSARENSLRWGFPQRKRSLRPVEAGWSAQGSGSMTVGESNERRRPRLRHEGPLPACLGEILLPVPHAPLSRRIEGHRPDEQATPARLQREVWLCRVAIAVTSAALGGFVYTFVPAAVAHSRGPLNPVVAIVFIAIVSMLVYAGLVYLIARIGYMRRRTAFRPASRQELADFVEQSDAGVCIVVPSYKEEPAMIRQTLLSAALQEYPHRRVVLLIDDPPNPATAEDRNALLAVRSLPGEIQLLLDSARAPFSRALREAEDRIRGGKVRRERETARLASLYTYAAAWFRAQACSLPKDDHSSALFAQMCLCEPAARHAAAAVQLRDRLRAHGPYPTPEEFLRSYRELDALFDVEVTSFERKRYASLSHAPNKAANLNSYIGLIGRTLRIRSSERGLELEDVAPNEKDLAVPDAAYVLTLDADSLLHPSYTARLVQFLEDPANARVAVAQTPYSAVPGAGKAVERIAGATTDLQYVIHQGLTAHGATYWVGANAVLRKRALDDIAMVVRDPYTGRTHVRYIQDRTVIEDTESSIDLVARGWQLFNYPARLSYSATPPDFGALVVQRRRWANGGLLVLPKLLRVLLRRQAHDAGALHGFMRVNYLVSIAAVNIGLTILFLVPFARWYANCWLPLTALPYYALYARDLRLAGYRRRDVVSVYALNLLLVPVNIGGVLSSLHQAMTGRVTPFKRTPKVSARTPAPLTYILAPQLLMLLLMTGSALSFAHGRPWQGAASAVNGLVLVYALAIFVGWRGSRSKLVAWLRLPPRTFRRLWATAARAAPLIAGAARPRKRKLVWAHQRT